MTETAVENEQTEQVQAPSSAVSDEQLVAMLVDRAQSEGLQLTGEGADADRLHHSAGRDPTLGPPHPKAARSNRRTRGPRSIGAPGEPGAGTG